MTRQEALDYQEDRVKYLTERLIREMERSIRNLQSSLESEKEFSYKLCSCAQGVGRQLTQAADSVQEETDKLIFLKSVFTAVQD